MLEATAEQKLEGIVAKRLDSPYEPGARGSAWIKIKNVGRQELVIGGWLPGEGRRERRIGALLVGVFDRDGGLRFAGRVGTGFSDAELDRLGKLLVALEREDSPFTAGERPPRQAVFVEPQLVAEIEFSEWTSAGVLRHPSYKGLREDKDAREVVREQTPPASSRQAAPRASAPREVQLPCAAIRERRRRRPATCSTRRSCCTSTAPKGDDERRRRELKLSNLDKPLYPRAGFASAT